MIWMNIQKFLGWKVAFITILVIHSFLIFYENWGKSHLDQYCNSLGIFPAQSKNSHSQFRFLYSLYVQHKYTCKAFEIVSKKTNLLNRVLRWKICDWCNPNLQVLNKILRNVQFEIHFWHNEKNIVTRKVLT